MHHDRSTQHHLINAVTLALPTEPRGPLAGQATARFTFTHQKLEGRLARLELQFPSTLQLASRELAPGVQKDPDGCLPQLCGVE
jgi:hypothetical protein